jgi:hypothetical protein
MQISGLSDTYSTSEAQRTLAMLIQQELGDGGQTAPSDPSPGPPPAGGLPPQSPAGQFAPETLSGLLSVQQDQPPSASDLAAGVMSQLDTNGDGEISSDELTAGLQAAQKPHGHHHHHHHHHADVAQANAQPAASGAGASTDGTDSDQQTQAGSVVDAG